MGDHEVAGDHWASVTRELERHAEAFDTRVFDASERDREGLTGRLSLGSLTARVEGRLVGFVNVPWDGLAHGWIQDVMVAAKARHRGIGVGMVHTCRDEAKRAGCEWLHVDFDDELRPFYFDASGFTPTTAGLMPLE